MSKFAEQPDKYALQAERHPGFLALNGVHQYISQRGIADHQTVAISFGIWMATRGKPLQMGETAREKRLERLIRISSFCHL